MDVTEEEEPMDRILFIVRDFLPMEAAKNLISIFDKIKGVKSVIDMKAFVMIEFNTKVDADAAKSIGFEIPIDNTPQRFYYSLSGTVQSYMTEKSLEFGFGKGKQ